MASTPGTTRQRPREGVSSAARVADLGARGSVAAPLEAACARLCRLAARLLGVPAVLVALKDEDRPFLAGSFGLEHTDPERWWGQTPLSVAISDQASPGSGALEVDDLATRELLAADPLHREHGFRALLALPLHPGPANFGSLVALSRSPRAWSADDAAVLADVADSVVAEIQLRGSVRLIRTVEEATAQAARRSFVGLVDGIDAVVKERDLADGRFTFVSKRAEALFGHPVERWTESPTFWRDVLVHPDDRDRASSSLDAAVAAGGGTLEYRARTADGRTVWVRDAVRVIGEEGGPRVLRGVIIDLTARKEAELELERKNRLLEMLQEITLRANAADDIEEPIRFTLERICRHLGWPVGHAWLGDVAPEPGVERPALVSTGIWQLAEPERYAAFRAATEATALVPGRGLPGRVLAAGRPAWIPSLAQDRDFPRADPATAAGLRAGFAFPILAGRDVVAIVELFTTEPQDPDDDLLDLAGHVGAILGRVMERRRADAERRAQEERTRRIVETAHDPFVAIGEDNAVHEWNPAAERVFGWSRAEALGRPLVELIVPPAYRDAHNAGFARFLRTGDGPLVHRRVELPATRKDGSEVPVELTISPVRVDGRWHFNAFLHDISERRRAEEDRARREKLLAETQKLARIGSWDWDMTTDSIAWSDQLHELFGTDPESFDPSFAAYLERLPEDDRALAQRTIEASLATHEPFEFEHRVERADGRTLLVRSQGRVVLDPTGRPARMMGTAQDVTEQGRAREQERQLVREQVARAEAEASQERIRGVLDSITDAFVAVDHAFSITFVNAAGERLLGGTAEELEGRLLLEVLPEAGADAIAEACRQVLASGDAAELETHLEEQDTWVEVRIFPSGEGLSLYLHDATDRRRAEELVRSSEARYRFLADSVPQQIWTADPTGKLDYVNQVVLDFTGRSFQRMLEEGWEGVLHPDDAALAAERWSLAIAGAQPLEIEARLRDGRGRYRWHLCRARCQTDAGGAVLRWYGTNTDIHGQKELEAARDQAVDDLERVTHLLSSERTNLEMQARELRRFARALKKSNEDLDRFAYVASHDLKAPLRGIANLTAWLMEDLEGKLEGDSEKYARLLQNRVQRMEALIDGILQYSRAGRTQEEPEDIDVGALVRDVIDMLDPPPHFQMDVEGYWPVLRSERVPLQQVFMNLIGNAIKHADGEHPVVTVRLRDEGTDFCEFSVSDNGPGIAPEYHDRIFTIFQTLRARDDVEGTGIGLSVVKRTVEHQGGQVWVESDVGQGATFSFLWPRDPDAKERTLG